MAEGPSRFIALVSRDSGQFGDDENDCPYSVILELLHLKMNLGFVLTF